ncbi:MAG: hypothetical protein NTW19_07960 [Planctomycetota bacterium]|nr:hypothetical protein [Planctomycetota bacterium]
MSHLAEHLRAAREQQKLSLGQVARQLGYRNVNKGIRRVQEFEDSGATARADLAQRLAELLEADPIIVAQLQRKDLQDWKAWIDESIPMRLSVRLMAAIYCETRIPSEVVTPEQAEDFAKQFAKANRVRCCLALSRRTTVYIDANGLVEGRLEAEPFVSNIPHMTIGGRTFILPDLGEQSWA